MFSFFCRLITPTKTGNKLSGILSKGPPNAIVSRSPPAGGGAGLGDTRAHQPLGTPGTPTTPGIPLPVPGQHTNTTPVTGLSPTAGHSPVSNAGLSLKIQPGLKQTLGLKESPQPALDVQQTGLNQNSPGRPGLLDTFHPNITKSEAAILSQVGLSPGNKTSSVSSTLLNHIKLGREKQQQQEDQQQQLSGNGGKRSSTSSSCGSVTNSSSDRGERHSKSPVKRPGSSTPIAQLYPELAEKLERTRSKPDVKLKGGDAKNNNNSGSNNNSKSGQKNSRTMNRLQNKIAQNKIKDKLKKSEKVAPLAMSLPNALTKEVAPNVTITPEMSALQAQLLSALPRRQGATGERWFPFTSMGNMAPLMNKLGPAGGDAPGGGRSHHGRHLHPAAGHDKSRVPPPPYPHPPGPRILPPGLDVSTAAATLAAAAAAAAAKTAEKQAAAGGSDGMRSPASSTSSRLGGGGGSVSPHSQPPPMVGPPTASPSSSSPGSLPSYSVPSSQHTVTSPRDSRCNMLPSTTVSSSTSHSLLGLPPPHPAPHLYPPAGGPRGGRHRLLTTPGNLSTGQPTVPSVRRRERRGRPGRPGGVLSEREAL